MTNSENQKPKIKVVTKRIPTLEELKLERPMMTDESGAAYRQKLIAAGTLTPGTYDGHMSSEQVKSYKEKLIADGLLRPGAGLARLKAAQEKARKMLRVRTRDSDEQ